MGSSPEVDIADPNVGARDRSLLAVQRVADELDSIDDKPAEFYERLSTAVAELVGAKRAGFFLLEGETLALQQRAFGIDPEVVARLNGILCRPVGSSAAELIVFKGERYLGSAGDLGGELLDPINAGDAVAVPWGAGRLRLGLLAAFDATSEGGFSEDDARVLQASATTAALIWQQRRLGGRLLTEKTTEGDHLRGIAKRLGELEEMKSHILNLAAHELRAPVAVIRGYLSMLEDGSLDLQGLQRILPILLGKAAQMDALITQMLDTARLEEGRIDIRRDRVELGAAVREAVDVAALLAPAGLSILLESAPEPLFVAGDRPRIMTIVGNLIDNAIKYSPGGGRVRCKVGSLDGRGYVSVSDDGLGIAAEDLPKLFTRFGRIVTIENSHIQGTGLGLHLSRELARLQGGDVTFQARAQVGSSFTLWLPLDVGAAKRGVNGSSPAFRLRPDGLSPGAAAGGRGCP